MRNSLMTVFDSFSWFFTFFMVYFIYLNYYYFMYLLIRMHGLDFTYLCSTIILIVFSSLFVCLCVY